MTRLVRRTGPRPSLSSSRPPTRAARMRSTRSPSATSAAEAPRGTMRGQCTTSLSRQYRLAQCHRYGWGIGFNSTTRPPNEQVRHSYSAPATPSLLENALPFYEIAAHNGHAGAQYVLGEYYERRNEDASAHYFNLAADQGHISACDQVGDPESHFYKTNSTKSQAKHYKAAADAWYDDSEQRLIACYKVGTIYRHCLGEGMDEEKAMYYFKESTKKVHHEYAEAAVQLGAMYANGESVKVNFTKAAKWYREAIREGDGFTGAERRLHRLHAEGHVL